MGWCDGLKSLKVIEWVWLCLPMLSHDISPNSHRCNMVKTGAGQEFWEWLPPVVFRTQRKLVARLCRWAEGNFYGAHSELSSSDVPGCKQFKKGLEKWKKKFSPRHTELWCSTRQKSSKGWCRKAEWREPSWWTESQEWNCNEKIIQHWLTKQVVVYKEERNHPQFGKLAERL